MRTEKFLNGAGTLTLFARIALVSIAPALASNSRRYWSPCVTPNDIYGPKVRYGLGIPWLYVPPEQLASFLLGLALHIRCLYNAALTMGEYMKKWLFALVCASTFLLAQNAVAAVQFTRFAHCGEGLVTAHTCECHAINSRIWHYCHAGYYCHTFDGSCRK